MSTHQPSGWRQATGGPVSRDMTVGDLSRVGEARRAADSLAQECGLDDEARGLLGVITTEAATNLARHATEGHMYLRDLAPSGRAGVEMLAVDRGPGMNSVSRYATDGFSTAGTSGTGLGAMKRLAHEFDIYSLPGSGTAVVARVFASSTTADGMLPSLVRQGVVCRPIDGETACGDGWSIHGDALRAIVLLVDGLGHGVVAAEAADVARERFAEVSKRSPLDILIALHEALRATRGAAMSIAEILRTPTGAKVTVAGVGNVTTVIVGPMGTRTLLSSNGTAGLNIRTPREYSGEWTNAERFVMCTDGITTRWQLNAYPGILQCDPALAAAVVHRDHSRGRDDATAMVFALGNTQPS